MSAERYGASVEALRIGRTGTAHELGIVATLPPADREEMEAWAVHLRILRGLSDRTTTLYLRAARKYLRFLATAGVTVGDATAAHVQSWQEHLYVIERAQGTTRALHLAAVRRLYAWRELRGLGASPARPVPPPKLARLQPRKYSTEHLRAMFRVCDRNTVAGRRDFALVMFLYVTGARREEMVTLSLSQVELQDRVGRVRIFGKGAKERTVPFERPLVDALRAYFADRDNIARDDAVWVGLRREDPGGRLSLPGMEGIFKKIVRAANIRPPNGLHRMRVTFATDLYDECGDIELVRVLLGHESIETTRKYIAISERGLKTRMPASRIYELTGERRNGPPLWAQRKLKQLRTG